MDQARRQLAGTPGAVRKLGQAARGGGRFHAPIIRPVERQPTDAELEAAVERLTDPDRFRAAEDRVARVAPQLQRILNQALAEGGWFGEAHEGELLKAATAPDHDDRLRALRTLLAEETRLGMLVGVAVGWELAIELEQPGQED